MNETVTPNKWALFPLFVFLVLFIGAGIFYNDFYKFPILIAALIALIFAAATSKGDINQTVERIARGAGNPDIMIMVFIFLLAGTFSGTANAIGAIDATVNAALSFLPQSLLMSGLFIIAAFISMAMGTSTGTIAALAPIALGIHDATGVNVALAAAAVVGGAMFGDNLSFISDTTIAAVRTQKTNMRDKFRTNFLIVLPAAVITVILLAFVSGSGDVVEAKAFEFYKLIPYLSVIVFALFGVNVILVLLGGTLLTGIIGMIDGSFGVSGFVLAMSDGLMGMAEISILTLLMGGLVSLITYNGGIAYLKETLTRKISKRRGAEFSMAALVSATNLATANNTISILVAGPLAAEIADTYDIDRKKSASILDLFSCGVQGIIPYGAQLLIAAELTKTASPELIPYLFYPFLLFVCGSLAIFFGFPRRKSDAAQKNNMS
ncbi:MULTISPECIES: Na+/H+ antiporter NhaC family protein [unclassified Exiguobacterium]|uniref:Na+/H+ antiporter NhaC family protein n=1 Tax=unclassified Exiguobacterium TaxID=2644629 RepID=UPI000B595D90|nr:MULTISPECIES: Na+/H+ antiporter NhaC family protein [unclassified Exiguobacterium]ASI36606.1 sodium:proton antiporter [Exiguobacterium sp. N4-1P]